MPEKTTNAASGSSEARSPVEVFYSYSHKDKELRDKLEAHLSILKRNGVIQSWHDHRISEGAEWKESIDEHLESAGVILLLVSADFLASDYCYDIEMKRAMERHAQGKARVIPVILRKCDWQGALFGKLQALPKGGQAIRAWNDIDEAFTDVVEGIKRTIEELTQPSAGLSSITDSTTADATLVGRPLSRVMEVSPEPERLNEHPETPAGGWPVKTPGKVKESAVGSVVQAAETMSRRTLIGVIMTAVLGTVGTISAVVIDKCGSAEQLSSHARNFAGRIINKNTEEKVRGAKVSLEGESGLSVAYSDSEGVFSFLVADPDKEIRLRIEASEYENFDLRITPAKNQGTQDVRLTPKTDKTAELSGTVLDRNDNPIQGAKVTLDDVLGIQPVETSSDGVFSLKDVPRKYGEMVRISVVKEGYQPNPYTEDVVLGKSPPRIKLTRKR